MENFENQYGEPTFYLYCLNTNCRISIYHRPMEVKVPFDAENLLSTHSCSCCSQTLVSSMDIEIKGIIAETSCSSSRMNITINACNLN
jgi:hypothetical protein